MKHLRFFAPFLRGCGLVFAAFAMAALLTGSPAHAQDTWTGPDKIKHAAVSAALGAGASLIVESEAQAVGLALLPGLAKELHDARPGGTGFSAKDMAANAIGAYLGVKLGGLIIRPNFIGLHRRVNL